MGSEMCIRDRTKSDVCRSCCVLIKRERRRWPSARANRCRSRPEGWGRLLGTFWYPDLPGRVLVRSPGPFLRVFRGAESSFTHVFSVSIDGHPTGRGSCPAALCPSFCCYILPQKLPVRRAASFFAPSAEQMEAILMKNWFNFPLCGPCLLYTSPSPRDGLLSRMPSSA